jgi:mannan endo-1,4-beta-mannosidase
MKLRNALTLVLGLAKYATAATSFAGSNLYYAAGLTSSQQTTLFTGLKDAGVQVLRVWLDGESLLISQSIMDTSQYENDDPNQSQANHPPKKAPK